MFISCLKANVCHIQNQYSILLFRDIFLVTIASANEREASSLSQYLSVYRYPLFRGTITHFCKYDERLSRGNG